MFDIVRAVAHICHDDPGRGEELFRSVLDRQIDFDQFIEKTVRMMRQSGRIRHADAVQAVAGNAGCFESTERFSKQS
jgi:hypothetical protein